MTSDTMLAPAGTIREFLWNLGITDTDAVHSVDIDPVGFITVKVKLRAADGSFMTGTYVDSPLPVVPTATLRFAEGDSDEELEFVSAGRIDAGREIRIIDAYHTEMAIEALDITTSGHAHDWEIISDEGTRGKLRTFTFRKL